MRVGIGYDVHRLAPERRLILGGVEVPAEQGLIGWSDADVLTHAIIDALLGAAAINVDATIVAEQPKLRDYISRMCHNLAKTLGITAGCVNVKASTSEQLGFAGREEGMVVWAVALISKETE